MHAVKHQARRKRRGVTLIELVVALTVIATAAVGTAIAVFNAYGQLQRQRHRMVANELLRGELEYWQGRIHTAMPTESERNQRGPKRDIVIDARQPGNANDDIIGQVWREPMRPLTLVRNSGNLQYFWEIPVTIQYTEPTWVLRGGQDAIVEYHLVGYWIESEPRNYAQ